MKYIAFVFFTLLATGPLPAQTLSDPVYFTAALLPDAPVRNRPGNLALRWVELNLSTPALRPAKNLRIFNAFYYRHTGLSFSESFSDRDRLPSTLHDLRYTLLVRMELHPRWELVALPRLLLRSDLRQALSREDFFPSMVLMGNYAVGGNPDFKIGLGLALNNDFAHNAIIPIGSLVYNAKKIRVEIVYPSANFIYKSGQDFELGFSASVEGAISRTTPVEVQPEPAAFVRTFQLLLAPVFSHRLHKSLYGHLRVGYAPVRTLTLLNRQYEALPGLDYRLEGALLVRAGISLRLQP